MATAQKAIMYTSAWVTLYRPEAVNIPNDRLAWRKIIKDTAKPDQAWGFRCPPGTQVDISKLDEKTTEKLVAGVKTPLAQALIKQKPESPGRTLVYTKGEIKTVKLDKRALDMLAAKKGGK